MGPNVAKHWRRLLVGLWWSGLRIGEAVALRWDGISAGLVIDMTGRRPMLRIDASAEKGNRNRLLPLAPEFCRLLARVPADKRRGLGGQEQRGPPGQRRGNQNGSHEFLK